MNTQAAKWAIVGTGYISNRFAQGMRVVNDAALSAVVSRSRESAERFAQQYGASAIYTSFDDMLENADIDVVYIGIPNDLHYDYIMRALDHRIPVLSEKPMVDTVDQLNAVYRKAEEAGLFLMEGMWTRCFPAVRKVREWIAGGAIGAPLSVNVCFDIKPDMDDWQPWKAGIGHAGGSLRDVGIYALGVANMVFPQKPVRITSVFHSNGEVDDSCRLFLDYGEGRCAFAGGAFNQAGQTTAFITGSEGRISFGPEFWDPSEALLERNDGSSERFSAPFPATGFQYEITAVQNALRKGLRECPDFTHAESRTVAGIIEETRKNWGIFYAADQRA